MDRDTFYSAVLFIIFVVHAWWMDRNFRGAE